MVQGGAGWCRVVQGGAGWCRVVQGGARYVIRISCSDWLNSVTNTA